MATYLQRLAADAAEPPRVVVLCGAGISTSAGIKDFRSAAGLYADRAVSRVFSASFLKEHPEQFYAVVRREFLPFLHGAAAPTPAHALLRLLKDRGWLTRVFTQNVDGLEYAAGLTEEDVVECHGSFRQAWCVGCGRVLARDEMAGFWASVTQGNVPCCHACGGVLRPDVVLFGEPLPARFHERTAADLPRCNLLLVLGTSLVVYPVAALPSQVGPLCVRALFNHEPSGCFQYVPPSLLPTEDAGRASESTSAADAMAAVAKVNVVTSSLPSASASSFSPLSFPTSSSVSSSSSLSDTAAAHTAAATAFPAVPTVSRSATAALAPDAPQSDAAPSPRTDGEKATEHTEREGRASSQYRDVFVRGSCDDAARGLAAALGWGADMEELCKLWRRSGRPQETAR